MDIDYLEQAIGAMLMAKVITFAESLDCVLRRTFIETHSFD